MAYIFDANTETPESITRRRAVADQLAARIFGQAPQNIGQGIASIGQALIARQMANEADASEKAGRASANEAFAPILGGVAGPSVATAPATPAAPTSITSASLPPIASTGGDSGLNDAIAKVAAARGVDPAYMTRLALVESGGNPNATTSLSSAKGPFQFINSTAAQYGLTNPTDPSASADAAARLTLDNKAALTQALGREPTPGELYLAHQQGAGGAAKILANPNAPIESVIGFKAASNNGAVPGMTAGQFAQKWTGRFADIGAQLSAQGSTPQITNASDPISSPLDNAQWPSGPIGAPGSAPATSQVADNSTIPAAAQPTQGYAIPGHGAPAQGPTTQQLIAAASNPWLTPGQKAVATTLLQQKLIEQKNAADPLRQLQIQQAQKSLAKSDEPTSVQEYKYYSSHLPPDQKPMPYDVWSTAKARAAATNVTTNVGADETAFQKEAGKVQAQRFNDLAAEGQQAKQMISDVGVLTDLGRNIGTGKGAELKATIGPYAEALGIKVDGLSDIQAYEAIVNRVAPTLRVKGSGAQSDYELKNFLKSLPSLGNTPEGNNVAATVMQGLQQNKILAAEIGSKALNGEISRTEADKQLRELPDPMTSYREYAKANKPAAPAAAALDKSAIEAEMKRRGLLK